MKFTLPILFIFASTCLWGQQHAFGISTGIQFPNFSSTTQGTPEEYLNVFGVEGVSGWGNIKATGGMYYRHQLTEKLYIEVAPSIFQEKYNVNYNWVNNSSSSKISGLILFFPASLRVDLGKKLFFNIGGGPNFFLSRKLEAVNGNGRIIEDKEAKAHMETFESLNTFPINFQTGISYGFGRISVNGKFMYRLSDIFGTVPLSGNEYSLDLKADYLQLEISYQLGKKNKN